jgi:hypothetical protein
LVDIYIIMQGIEVRILVISIIHFKDGISSH